MAEINFQLLHNANGTAAVDNLGGSGLAFYGSPQVRLFKLANIRE